MNFRYWRKFQERNEKNPICSFTNLSDVKFTYDNSESSVSSKTGRRGQGTVLLVRTVPCKSEELSVYRQNTRESETLCCKQSCAGRDPTSHKVQGREGNQHLRLSSDL